MKESESSRWICHGDLSKMEGITVEERNFSGNAEFGYATLKPSNRHQEFRIGHK